MTLVILDVVVDTVGLGVAVAAWVDGVGLDVTVAALVDDVGLDVTVAALVDDVGLDVAALVDAVGLAPLTGEVALVEQATIPGKINSIKIH
jgi:hypothetical protein